MDEQNHDPLPERISNAFGAKYSRLDSAFNDFIPLFDSLLKEVGLPRSASRPLPIKASLSKSSNEDPELKWDDTLFVEFMRKLPDGVDKKDFDIKTENLTERTIFNTWRRAGSETRNISAECAEITICWGASIRSTSLEKLLAQYLGHCKFEEKVKLKGVEGNELIEERLLRKYDYWKKTNILLL